MQNESQSVEATPSPLQGVLSVDRLSSLHQIHDLPLSNSHVSSKIAETDQQQANNEVQTEGLETIADEDAPMKVIHNGECDMQLTEVGGATPVIPAGFRAQPFNAPPAVAFEGMVNLEPCGEYCQWLTAEA